MIVSVPPYHIAAVANLLSNLYSGRRIVYLNRFTAREWLEIASAERITHAMVVPTMLARIVDELETGTAPLPGQLRIAVLRRGAAVAEDPRAGPRAAARRRLRQRLRADRDVSRPSPSSGRTITAPRSRATTRPSGPGSARLASPSPRSRSRSGPLTAKPCGPGQTGLIYVRGPQVAGEYRETGETTDPSGWFSTRDEGYLDDGGLPLRPGPQR